MIGITTKIKRIKTGTMKEKTAHHSQIGDTGEIGGVFTMVQETPENVF
jgi:hypothetical protein